ARPCLREDDTAGKNRGADGMKAIVEAGDDPEIAATAPQPPEEIGVLVGARMEHPAVGCHDLCRKEVVAGEPEAPAELAEATAQCEARNAGIAVDTHGRREAAGLRGPIEFSERQSRFGRSKEAA